MAKDPFRSSRPAGAPTTAGGAAIPCMAKLIGGALRKLWLMRSNGFENVTVQRCSGLPTMSLQSTPAGSLDFAKEMKNRHLTIPFECITRADRLNEAVADALAELECYRVWIGSESGSQRILDAMERNVTVEEVRSGVSLCRERGIQTGLFLMWGYPGRRIIRYRGDDRTCEKIGPRCFSNDRGLPD